MIMEHCMINGVRCTKCCDVLLINKKTFHRKWLEYVRRSDHDTEYAKRAWAYDVNPDNYNILMMIRPVKKRIAKKKTPYVFSNNKEWVNQSAFFKCKHLTKDGCSNYENRPSMCSGYPHYGKSKEEWQKEVAGDKFCAYTSDCTFVVEVQEYKPTK